ncbi:GDSL esterase/lipase At1g29660 [Ziziphus jujuba]|uniref:GDSL esterase/lipase At1g29660 n=1 Tax=Ziziphus jujuba TaxID=326968 RepID=A0ABM3ZYW5_ZIZJJ|nr:GDSL esterase/lipase At1g29660 [Ziziphus jujuba]
MASQSNELLSALISLCVIAFMKVSVDGAPKVQCYFIFGDSLADSGNNNPLRTFAKANYPPYGIDFPNKTPTGRFCNGLTTADIIGPYNSGSLIFPDQMVLFLISGQRLGFTNLIPPFTLAHGSTILQGVNYASASAGIREETGRHLVHTIFFGIGQNICLDGQLNNHRAIVSRITALLKTKAAAKAHLRKCIYYVGLGSNDYINNYFLPNYPTSKEFNPDEYADALIDQYANQLVVNIFCSNKNFFNISFRFACS